MAVGRLRIDGNFLARDGAHGLCHLKRPQHARSRDEELIVDNVHAQALAPAVAEAVRTMLGVSEVGVLGQGLLVSREGRVEPPVWAEVLWVWVLLRNAVDSPTGTRCQLISASKGWI